MAIKYILKLDSTGYYSKNVKWKTVSKNKATWFTSKKEILKLRNWFTQKAFGFHPSIEEIEDD